MTSSFERPDADLNKIIAGQDHDEYEEGWPCRDFERTSVIGLEANSRRLICHDIGFTAPCRRSPTNSDPVLAS
jgi:hypothetical protein